MATNTTESTTYGIRLTFVDDLKNGFTTIGGAAWETEAEQAQAWAAIPALAEGDESDFIADLMGSNGVDVLDEKRVSAETCEQLMGKSIVDLIAEGRESTIYTWGELKARRPELFA